MNDNPTGDEGSLVVIEPATGAVHQLAGTEGAAYPLWLPEGILFARPLQPGNELMLLPNGTGAAAASIGTPG